MPNTTYQGVQFTVGSASTLQYARFRDGVAQTAEGMTAFLQANPNSERFPADQVSSIEIINTTSGGGTSSSLYAPGALTAISPASDSDGVAYMIQQFQPLSIP